MPLEARSGWFVLPALILMLRVASPPQARRLRVSSLWAHPPHVAALVAVALLLLDQKETPTHLRQTLGALHAVHHPKGEVGQWWVLPMSDFGALFLTLERAKAEWAERLQLKGEKEQE